MSLTTEEVTVNPTREHDAWPKRPGRSTIAATSAETIASQEESPISSIRTYVMNAFMTSQAAGTPLPMARGGIERQVGAGLKPAPTQSLRNKTVLDSEAWDVSFSFAAE